MKKSRAEISKEAKKRLLDASFALRLSFNRLSKSCLIANNAFKQAGPAMEKALKKCRSN